MKVYLYSRLIRKNYWILHINCITSHYMLMKPYLHSSLVSFMDENNVTHIVKCLWLVHVLSALEISKEHMWLEKVTNIGDWEIYETQRSWVEVEILKCKLQTRKWGNRLVKRIVNRLVGEDKIQRLVGREKMLTILSFLKSMWWKLFGWHQWIEYLWVKIVQFIK
jgi:hypothetical protein